jgi:hypothetical protein
VYDAKGNLVTRDQARKPPSNARYPGVDEIYLRTWDSHNKYQVDWVYAGPPSGDPTRAFSS